MNFFFVSDYSLFEEQRDVPARTRWKASGELLEERDNINRVNNVSSYIYDVNNIIIPYYNKHVLHKAFYLVFSALRTI